MTAIFWTRDGQWEAIWHGIPATLFFPTRDEALAWIHDCIWLRSDK